MKNLDEIGQCINHLINSQLDTLQFGVTEAHLRTRPLTSETILCTTTLEQLPDARRAQETV